MLKLQNIDKSFFLNTPDENQIFEKFNLEIPTGQFVTIIGSNGSGKTTLLNLLSGTLMPESGRILKDGKDITHQKEHVRAQYIGRVFQDPSMGTAGKLTVLENLSIASNKGKKYGLRPAIKKDRVDFYKELLTPLGMGLENRLFQPCRTLSGGQRQALALLMSTMVKPDMLILDEHTAALDPRSADTVMRLTREIVEKEHFSVVMVTHNLRFALEYGDRLLMMHEGQVILDKEGEAKEQLVLDDVLDLFYNISIEVGNTV